MSEQKKNVASPSAEYEKNIGMWTFISDILGGTEVIRALGKRYLPQHVAESDENYDIRLKNSTFAPLYRLLSESMTGRVFAKDAIVTGLEKDESFQGWLKDIDRAGTRFSIFAQEAFQSLVDYGLCYIFVDYSKGKANGTLEEEKKSGARPYMVWLKATDVISFRYQKDSFLLEECRIKENETVYENYSEKKLERIRVLKPGAYEIHEKRKDAAGNEMWAVVERGLMTVPIVPVVPIFAQRLDSRPPLLEAAFLNVKYYQCESNHENALSVAQFPILGATGVGDDMGKIKIGPKKLLSSPDPQAKFFYLEHSGTALECGRKRLEDIKNDIASMGLKLLSAKAQEATKTATENVLDDKQSSCVLESMANRFADGLRAAFLLMALWVNKTVNVDVKVVGSFMVERKDTAELNSLVQMKMAGDLSRTTLWNEFKRRGVLADTFDQEKEKELIALEGPSLTGEPRFDDSEDDEEKTSKKEIKSDEKTGGK